MRASAYDSVLIEQVVYLASKARVATGQDPIFDMPKGISKAHSCPIQRALNLHCTVSASNITFTKPEHAQAVAEACGLSLKSLEAGLSVTVPEGHPFRSFVKRFDQGTHERPPHPEAQGSDPDF